MDCCMELISVVNWAAISEDVTEAMAESCDEETKVTNTGGIAVIGVDTTVFGGVRVTVDDDAEGVNITHTSQRNAQKKSSRYAQL